MAKTTPKPPPQLLAITAHDDAHLPAVQKYLAQPLIVIDPLALVVGYDVSYEHHAKSTVVSHRNQVLSNVHGVWYRKPTLLEPDTLASIPENLRDYAGDAIKEHCKLIRNQFPEAIWISPFHAIDRANNKSFGLRQAANLGLRIPDTLFTSDETRARDFMSRYPVTIVKSLSHMFPRIGDSSTMFFAKKVRRNEPIDLHGLRLAPAVFQQAVDAAYDIRVCVVGDQLFASKVTNDNLKASAIRDWRYGHFADTVAFEPYEGLDKNTARQCIALTRHLGLQFGAIDLVRDTKGHIWFLEINPNGQWAFADDITVDRVGAAIANLLQSRSD